MSGYVEENPCSPYGCWRNKKSGPRHSLLATNVIRNKIFDWKSFHMCNISSSKHRQASSSHELPSLPWEKVGGDFLDFNGKKYLMKVDYYSKYTEMAMLTSTNATNVISHCGPFSVIMEFPLNWYLMAVPCFLLKNFPILQKHGKLSMKKVVCIAQNQMVWLWVQSKLSIIFFINARILVQTLT